MFSFNALTMNPPLVDCMAHANRIDKENKTIHIKNSKRKRKPYTPEQIKVMLEDYDEVPAEKWTNIPLGTHIRYYKKTGQFIRGGFVQKHWVNAKGNRSIRITSSSFGAKGALDWYLAFDKIDKLYAKKKAEDPSIVILNNRVKDIMKSINSIVAVVKKHEVRLEQLEKQNQQIIQHLKTKSI